MGTKKIYPEKLVAKMIGQAESALAQEAIWWVLMGIAGLLGLFLGPFLWSRYESWKNKEYKGFNLTFDPKTRSFFKDVWIDTGEGEPLIHVVKTPEVVEEEAPAKEEEEASDIKKTTKANNHT